MKALCLVTPAALGPQYFREAAEVMNGTAGGPPDRAKMAEIMRRHGLAGSAPASDVPLLPPMQDVNINDECGIDAFRQSSAE